MKHCAFQKREQSHFSWCLKYVYFIPFWLYFTSALWCQSINILGKDLFFSFLTHRIVFKDYLFKLCVCVCLCDCMCRCPQKPEESLRFCAAGTMGSCQLSDISARNCPQVLHKSGAHSHLLSRYSSSERGFSWGIQDKYYCSSEHCRIKMIGGMGREFGMCPPTCWNLCRHEETKREKTEECSPGQASRRSKDTEYDFHHKSYDL